MEESINFLSFLIIVLIIVIVSPKAKETVRRFVDFIPRLLKYSLILGVVALLIYLLVFLIVWAWNTLHEIFPRLWSIGEIIGIISVLMGMALIAIIVNYIDGKLKNKYGEKKMKAIYKRIGNIFKSIGYDLCTLMLLTLLVVSATLLFFYHNDKILTIGLLGSFSLYLAIKYIILPTGKLLLKRKLQKT